MPCCRAGPTAAGVRRLAIGSSAAVKRRSLIDCRHEARSPVPRAAGHRGPGRILHDHETGQVRVLGSEAVGHPASQRGSTRQGRAGVHLADAPDMIQPVGPARSDHRQLIGAGRDVRKPVGNPDSTLAVLLPFSLRGQQRRSTFSHGGDHRLEARRKRLARQPVQLRLGVERVDMARPTFHEQENDAARRALATPRRFRRQSPDSADRAELRRSRASRSRSARPPKPAPASSNHSRRVAGRDR